MSSNPQLRSPQLIELRKVVKTYQSAAGAFTALRGIDLQIAPGEFGGEFGDRESIDHLGSASRLLDNLWHQEQPVDLGRGIAQGLLVT